MQLNLAPQYKTSVIYSFKNLIKELTCFTNSHNWKCIDFILTNTSSFQNPWVIETEFSDFHKMTVTVLRSYYPKLETQIVKYRDYKIFSDEKFRW